MTTGPQFYWVLTVILSLLLVGKATAAATLEGNALEESNNAGASPKEIDPSSSNLIDQVLNSDYFDQDYQPDAPSGHTPDKTVVQPLVPNGQDIKDEVFTTGKPPFCLGCPVEVDISDPKIVEVAGFAFQSHLSAFDRQETAQRMVRVVNAMSQVVSGQKYIIDLEVGLTNCTKAQHDQDPTSCAMDPSEDTFICNFEVVEQSWVGRKEVVRSNCKREKVQELQDDGDDELEEQDAVVEEDSDEIEGEAVKVAPPSSTRRKRQAPGPPKKILGGSRDTEESPEKLMELAKFAVQQLDMIDADDEARLVMEVLESKKQTVSGWLYDLKIRVAHTTCKENEHADMEKCKDKIVLPYRVCSIKILFQPWQEVQRKVTESQCLPEKAYYKNKKGKKLAKQLNFDKENEVIDDKKPHKAKVLGGFQDIDVKSTELTELVNFIIESIDQQSNAMHAQKLVKIIEAQRQVVAGFKTKLVVELGYTGCRKNPTLVDKAGCEIDGTREHTFCNVTVWEQPWIKSKQITHSKCGLKETMFQDRTKRSLNMFHFKSEDREPEFKSFMEKHEKQYESGEEYTYRLGVFKENMKKVKMLQDNEQGNAIYGSTLFADLTEEEFSKHYLGLRPDLRQGSRATKKAKVPFLSSIPDEFDWRNYNAVTPVKNQGMCGSCWAFSVTGNIEGLYYKKHNKLMSFSEQELVDCDTLDEGCNGGLPENAYKSLQKLGGLEQESVYPYDGHNQKCTFDASKATAKVTGFVELPKNETEMVMWLVKNGPISIGINANAMQFYMGGVSHPWKFLCGKKSLDHGVLIVGYGVHTYPFFNRTLPYWSVKNSWGPTWGEQGYYRVYRGENTCGIAEMATSAIVE